MAQKQSRARYIRQFWSSRVAKRAPCLDDTDILPQKQHGASTRAIFWRFVGTHFLTTTRGGSKKNGKNQKREKPFLIGTLGLWKRSKICTPLERNADFEFPSHTKPPYYTHTSRTKPPFPISTSQKTPFFHTHARGRYYGSILLKLP